MKKISIFTVICLILFNLFYLNGNVNLANAMKRKTVSLQSIMLDTSNYSLVLGGSTSTKQVRVTALYSDGTKKDVTSISAYSSSNQSVFTSDSTGLLTGKSVGSANLSVSYNGKAANASVSVGKTLNSISVNPLSINLAQGKTQQIVVNANYSDGSVTNVTSQSQYTTSNASVATVSTSGLITAVASGSAIVTVNYGGLMSSISVAISNPVTLTSINANPASITLPSTQTQQIAITANYSDNSTKDVTSQSQYTTSNAGVATVSSSGLITAVASGNAIVTVNYGGLMSSISVAVSNPVTLTSINANPASITLTSAQTQQIDILANYSDNSTKDVTLQSQYTTSNAGVATVSSSGLITAVASGSATIATNYGGLTSTIAITVNPAYVPVTQFGATGNDQLDDTKAVQSAIDYGATNGKTIDFPSGNYYINPDIGLSLRNNSSLYFENGAKLISEASSNSTYFIVKIWGVTNVKMFGNPTIVGDRNIHTGTGGESGMGIGIANASSIDIENANISNCWGDGIYIGDNGLSQHYDKDVAIKNAVLDNNRRQGISVISAINLAIDNPKITNTNGTAPAAGIDFEPNYGYQYLQNITVTNPYIQGNDGHGIQFSIGLGPFQSPVSINVINASNVKNNELHNYYGSSTSEYYVWTGSGSATGQIMVDGQILWSK